MAGRELPVAGISQTCKLEWAKVGLEQTKYLTNLVQQTPIGEVSWNLVSDGVALV